MRRPSHDGFDFARHNFPLSVELNVLLPSRTVVHLHAGWIFSILAGQDFRFLSF